MSLPRYPEYQESGVEWLGTVPAHWELSPLKHLADFLNGCVFKPGSWSETGTPIIRIENLNGSLSFNYYNGDVEPKHHVRKGDLLFGWSGNRGTSFGPFIWSLEGSFFLNQHIFKVAPANCDTRWLFWCLRAVTAHVEDQATGIIGMVHVTKGDLGAIKVPLPPLEEQRSQAAFLDRETAKIDALIAEQEKLLALLAEKRQATISHAVTRGLDPNAPMKDSGIPWLGEVPAHWEVVPFKYCVHFQEGPGIMADDFRDEGVPLLRVSGVRTHWAALEGCNYLDPEKVQARWSHFKVEEGDLLISASASMGTVCEVGPEAAGSVPYTGIIKLKAIDGMMVKNFVRHVVVSGLFLTQIDLLKAGATIQHFGPTHISQMDVARPPEREQQEIAACLDAALADLAELQREAGAAIELLWERRSALVSAAVTGQVDVRGFVEAQAA